MNANELSVSRAYTWFDNHFPGTSFLYSDPDFDTYLLFEGGQGSYEDPYRVVLLSRFTNPETVTELEAAKMQLICPTSVNENAFFSSAWTFRLSRPQYDFRGTSFENSDMEYSPDYRVMMAHHSGQWAVAHEGLEPLKERLCN